MSRSELIGTAVALAAGCLCFLGLTASARGATTRYAAYDGTGSECTAADPCAARTAVLDAVDGDTVVLLYTPGHDYEICGSCIGLAIEDEITLRGEPGQPRPTIKAPASGFWPAAIQVKSPGVVVEGLRVEATDRQALALSSTGDASNEAEPVDGSVVRDVELRATDPGSGPAVYVEGDSTLERATVIRTGTTTRDALWLAEGPLVRDSVVLRAAGAAGEGIRTFGSEGREIRLRNMTIGATGDAIFALEGPYELSIRNTLIDGQLNDIAATGTSLHVAVSYSSLNPAQITDHPPEAVVDLVAPNHDQRTEAFELANPAGFDFHQLAGSPTIDAGSADAFTGALDIDGEPRSMGAAVDIGADEFADAEAPETIIDSGPGEGSVVASAALRFEFSSPAADVAGFECSLDGGAFSPCASPYATPLLADGPHAFRVHAFDLAGNVDPTPASRSFSVDTTMPAGPGTGTGAPTGASPASRRDGSVAIAIRGRRLKLRGRRAVLRLSCPAAEVSPPCAGVLVLKTAAKLGAGDRRRRVPLATARFSIAAGKTQRVALRFTKRAMRLLSKNRAARRTRAIVSVRDGAGNRASAMKALRLVVADPHRLG
jgi:hypothetical protein